MTPGDYMGAVAGLGCGLCRFLGLGATPAEVHHRRAGTGGGRRASDYDTMPLCPEHHRGDTGLHGLGTKGFSRTYGIDEAFLIAQTRALLGLGDELVEAWKQADDDRRRSRPRKQARGPKVGRAPAARSRWPSRKLESASRLRSRPLRPPRRGEEDEAGAPLRG